MVDLQQQPFSTASPIAVNYSFSDISSGVSFQNYNGYVEEDSAGLDYFLNSQNIFTSDILVAANDIDIDTPVFDIPQTINGDAVVQLSYAGTNMANSDNVIPTITIYKYDGTTETQLGTATGPTLSGIDPGNDVDRSTTLVIPLTRTTITKGDLIRVTIGSAGNNTLKLYMSPNNLGTPFTNALHTKFILSVPFEL